MIHYCDTMPAAICYAAPVTSAIRVPKPQASFHFLGFRTCDAVTMWGVSYPAGAIDSYEPHQVKRTWAPGAMHVHVTSAPRLNMNPFSLAATKVSSSTVTSSSPSLSSSISVGAPSPTCGEATNVRVFLGRTPAAGAISWFEGRWKSYVCV